MYEKIRKPKLLKDVPLSLIRPLPVIYYANYYAKQNTPAVICNYYQSNIRYLSGALHTISELLKNDAYDKIAHLTSKLDPQPSKTDLDKVITISTEMGALCSANQKALRESNQEIKNQLSAQYLAEVNTIKLVVVDNRMGSEDISNILNILKNFCQYKVVSVEPNAPEIITKLIDADVVLFYSIASPDIHYQVKSLQTFHKPGLALAKINGKGAPDKEVIRHGAQLMKTGFCVLFKMFTPLRLFTSIDKLYIAFHLHS